MQLYEKKDTNILTGLSEDVLKRMCDVFSRYSQVDKFVLFGTRASGNYRPNSDIDLTLFGTDITLQTFSQVSHKLDDLLLLYIIGISIFHGIKEPSLLESILDKGIVLYLKSVNEDLLINK